MTAASGHAASNTRATCAAALTLLTSVARAEPPPTHLKCLGRGLFNELVMMKIDIDVPPAFGENGTTVVPGRVRLVGVIPNREMPGVSAFLGTMNRPLEFNDVNVVYSRDAGPLVVSSNDAREGSFLLNRIVTTLQTDVILPKDGAAEAFEQTLSTECYLDPDAAPGDWSWIDPFHEWPY